MVGAATAASNSTATAATQTEIFDYTGTAQTWTVPPAVTEATFDLYGAQGAGFSESDFAGGLGGRATATIAVTPGDSVEVNVGGQDGFNGGGAGNNTGGGASDIRQGGSGLGDRALVAGGGGGSGTANCLPGGVFGGAGGGEEGDAAPSGCGRFGGGGGAQDHGGSATSPAIGGDFGVGGNGTAGGGGGGWYGGGGGSNGGGGGSGHGPPGTVFETGVRSGNGLVKVSYELRPAPKTTITSGPEGLTGDPSPSFSFESDQASTFECSLDGAAFAACDSPQGYENLADGAHSFSVRATNDQLTTETTPQTRDFTVDTSADGSASAMAKQGQAKNRVSVKLKLRSSEPLRAKAKGKIKLGRKDFKLSPQSVDLDAGATQTMKLKPKKDQDRILKGLAAGQSAAAKLQVKFTDSAGNASVNKLQVKLTR